MIPATRCPSCGEDLTARIARQRQLMRAAGEDSFPFACPKCSAFFSLDVGAGDAMTLRLLRGGGIATPDLFGVILEDPEVREGLLHLIAEEREEEGEASGSAAQAM